MLSGFGDHIKWVSYEKGLKEAKERFVAFSTVVHVTESLNARKFSRIEWQSAFDSKGKGEKGKTKEKWRNLRVLWYKTNRNKKKKNKQRTRKKNSKFTTIAMECCWICQIPCWGQDVESCIDLPNKYIFSFQKLPRLSPLCRCLGTSHDATKDGAEGGYFTAGSKMIDSYSSFCFTMIYLYLYRS